MKSAFKSLCALLWKEPSLFQAMFDSIPRIARFILQRRQVVWFDSWPEEKKRLFVVARSNPNWTTVYAAALIAASTSARAADLRGLRWSDH